MKDTSFIFRHHDDDHAAAPDLEARSGRDCGCLDDGYAVAPSECSERVHDGRS